MENNLQDNLFLDDDGFIDLRGYIYNLCGLYYSDAKRYLLESRIKKRINSLKMKSFYDYINFIKCEENKSELFNLFEAITINETYFFRVEQQFEALEKVIFQEIIKNKTQDKTIRIWSAASSTGEEAYTIAMIFLEKIKPFYPDFNLQIIGSDINNAVLDEARRGIYKDYSIRNMPELYLNKYFLKQGNNYVLSNEVKNIVRFINLNLYDENQLKNIKNCDIIFCCNVLMYFDSESKQSVVNSLYNSLHYGGYLFIGYSESLHGVSKAFKLVHLSKAMAYKKE